MWKKLKKYSFDTETVKKSKGSSKKQNDTVQQEENEDEEEDTSDESSSDEGSEMKMKFLPFFFFSHKSRIQFRECARFTPDFLFIYYDFLVVIFVIIGN